MPAQRRSFAATVLASLLATAACSSDGSGPGRANDAGNGGDSSGGSATNTGGALGSGARPPVGGSGGGGSSAGGNTQGSGGNASGGAPGSGSAPSTGGTAGPGGSGGSNTGGTPDIGTPITPGDPGASDVQIDVRADRVGAAISPLIYGTNGAPEIAKTRQTVVRSGGNRLTAYNWENNASNAGSDWYFQNDGLMGDTDTPAKAATDVVDVAAANGAASIITIPVVDYVSRDKNGGGDVRNSGPDYLTTRFRKNVAAKGSAFGQSPDPNDANVYQDEFVAFLQRARPSARLIYSLDNEPDLWSHTHAEVHPAPVTYAELWERNERFSKAIKAVAPNSEILGFVSYGYMGYVNLQNAPDHGNRNFIEWYLDQASAAERAAGKRLIDYLDVHWYPEATGGGQRIISGTDEAVVAARLQAPRSLWDSTYSEDSWIVNDVRHSPIDLIHDLRKKIDARYPGTRLAFTEWNYGGGADVSGALAVADVLGVFGREGVGLATYWALTDKEPFAWAGFRVYRNFDGTGGAFGDTAVEAQSSDIPNATVYASIDSKNPARTVIVAINKSRTARAAGIRITHGVRFTSAAVHVLSGTTAELVAGTALTPAGTNAFRYTMPARSVSVIVPQP